jgi:hypothetical protein
MARLALAVVLLAACGSKKPSTPDARPAIPDAAQKEAKETEEADDIRPVYPVDDQPPDERAARLCRAMHEVPARRKAECCGGSPAPSLVSECARTLSYALRLKVVTIDTPSIDACEQAMTRAHQGCEWVGPLAPSFPPECLGVIHGALATGSRCRSSLECGPGLRCRGLGPTDPGTCGPPLPESARCSVAVDTLVTYTRQDAWIERTHPECAGFCTRRACRAALAEGAACRVTPECGPGHRCADGKCVAGGEAQLGETCSANECAAGLRCWQNRCIAPKAAGESCKTPFECQGGCVDRKCAMKCRAVP